MTPEQIDELLKKPVRDRRVMWFPFDLPVFVLGWSEGGHTVHAVKRLADNAGLIYIFPDKLSPIEPPKPKRVRFSIDAEFDGNTLTLHLPNEMIQ